MNSGTSTPGGVISVSCPGGIAAQFRVQVTSGETASLWKMVGSFRHWREAAECAAVQSKIGRKARIIAWRSLPTAA